MNYHKHLAFMSIIFSIISLPVISQEYPDFQYILPTESKILTNYQTEKDPKRKKDLEQKLIAECPFRKIDSAMDNLTKEALSLQASVTNSNNLNNCQGRLNGFSESIKKTQDLQNRVKGNSAELTEEDKKAIEDGLLNTQVAATTFNEILRSGCEFKNSTRDISSVGNQLINLLDSGTTVLAFTNPTGAIFTAAASISGRLVISLSRWLSETDESQQLVKEVNQTSRFLNELCLFRNLAYKYDDLYIDPLIPLDRELLERQVIRNKAASAANEMRQCVNIPSPNNHLATLTSFSKELAEAVDGVTSQKQCLALLKKYNINKTSEGTNNLSNLATSYGCPSPNPESSENIKLFCYAWDSVEQLSSGNIYDKCEDEIFQRNVTKKFTSLADLLFLSVQDNIKPNPVINADELQKLRELEKAELIATQRYAALESSLKESMMSNVNATKSMLSLGRTVLGDRFDDFAKETLKGCSDDLSSADKFLSKIKTLKKKADKTKDPIEREERQRDICTKATDVRTKLATTYQSSMGVREICAFMRDKGVPPLKSTGLSFDNYSTESKRTLFFKTPYLSERCDKINIRTDNFIKEVTKQTITIDNLGCNF